MNELSDQFLVQRVLQGDEAAFEMLCKRYYISLQAVAYAVLMDRHLAEDAVQETLAVACGNFAKLQTPEKTAGWLAAICRNTAKTMLDRQKKHVPLRLAQRVQTAEHDSLVNEQVRNAVFRLPPALREIVVMRYFDDRSYAQIGQILGLTQQAINGRLRRAKRKIEKSLRIDGFGSDVS